LDKPADRQVETTDLPNDSSSMADNNSAAACSLLRSIFSDDFVDSGFNSTAAAVNTSFPPSAASPVVDRLKLVITSVIIPVFCGLGVVGNVMTIVIMSQRRMATAMSCKIKRASRAGLVGLAAADLLCCVTALAITYGRDDDAAAYSEHQQVRVLTAIYGPFVLCLYLVPFLRYSASSDGVTVKSGSG